MTDMPDTILKFHHQKTPIDTGFDTWKGLMPVQLVAHQLGLAEMLAKSKDWDDYTSRFIAANDNGLIVKAAQTLFADLATEDRNVLAAMLHAADFSRVADELSERLTWWRLSRVGGDNALAVALAVMRQ